MIIPVWGPTFRISFEILINSFAETNDDRDKFLMVGWRFPLMGLFGRSLYTQAKFDYGVNRTGTSFRTSLGTWISIVVSQYIEDNEVKYN